MSKKNITNRIQNALKDPAFTDDQVRWLDQSLRSSMVECGAKATKSIFLFGVFVIAWMMLRGAAVAKISVMGLEISNVEVVMPILPVLSAFCFYQFCCYEAMVETIITARWEIYRNRYKNLYDQNIEQMLACTGTLLVDDAIRNLQPLNGWFAQTWKPIWLIVFFIGMFVLPFAVLCWMIYGIVMYPPLGWVWSLVSAVVTILFMLRACLILGHFASLMPW